MKTVLFVCVHNSGRSQMAEALFNRLARGKMRALSAGIGPSDAVNPTVVAAMEEVGIDISKNVPKALTPVMLDSADKVVMMGCGVEAACPTVSIDAEDWGLADPEGRPLNEVRAIRNEIERRVAGLLKEQLSG